MCRPENSTSHWTYGKSFYLLLINDKHILSTVVLQTVLTTTITVRVAYFYVVSHETEVTAIGDLQQQTADR